MEILFVIIAGILLLIRKMLQPTAQEKNAVPAMGVIQKEIQDNGRILFYVEFRDGEGKTHVGQTEHYARTYGKYHTGDSVKIRYFFTPKGKPFVLIDDEALTSCGKETEPAARVLLVTAVVLLILAAGMAVKDFLL